MGAYNHSVLTTSQVTGKNEKCTQYITMPSFYQGKGKHVLSKVSTPAVQGSHWSAYALSLSLCPNYMQVMLDDLTVSALKKPASEALKKRTKLVNWFS